MNKLFYQLVLLLILFGGKAFSQCDIPSSLSYTYDEDSIYFRWKGSPNAQQYIFGYSYYNKIKTLATTDTTFSLSLFSVQGDADVLWLVRSKCDGVTTEPARSSFHVSSQYTCNQPTDLNYTYDEDSIYFRWRGSPNAIQYSFQYAYYNTIKSLVTSDTTLSLSLFNVQGGTDVLWLVKTQCDGAASERARSFFNVPEEYTCNQPSDLSYSYDEDSLYFRWKGSPNAMQYTFQYIYYNTTKSLVTSDTTLSLSLLAVQGGTNVVWLVRTQCNGATSERARSTFNVPSQYTCNQPTNLSYTYDKDSIYFSWNGSPNALSYKLGYYYSGGSLRYFDVQDTVLSLSTDAMPKDVSKGWVVKCSCEGITTDWARSTFFIRSPAQYYAIQSGMWDNSSVWALMPGGTSANNIPGALDDVFIDGFTITIGQDQASGSIHISNKQAGGGLIIENGTLTVNGKIRLENRGNEFPELLKVRNQGCLKVK